MPTDHPLNVGMLGMHGNYGPNILTNDKRYLKLNYQTLWFTRQLQK